MIPVAKPTGREISYARVLSWYQLLPIDLKKRILAPKPRTDDLESRAVSMADKIFATWPVDRRRAADILASDPDLMAEIGPAARVRLLSLLTMKDCADGTNAFAVILAAIEAEESDTGDGTPAATVMGILRSDVANVNRMIAARMVRATSASVTVDAMNAGIEILEKSLQERNGLSKQFGATR